MPVLSRFCNPAHWRLKECVEAWCEIEAQGYRGWLQRDNLWGVYAFERLD
ncbi:MAG: SH3 domain-containing protein [Parvibaculales bacterium]